MSIELLKRRRDLLMTKAEQPLIERPDWMRVDFTTSADNFTLKVGILANANPLSFILDEVTPSASISGDGQYDVIVPTAGSHVLYIKSNNNYSANYSFALYVGCSYMRWPYNFHSRFPTGLNPGNRNRTWTVIDVLDPSYCGNFARSSQLYGIYDRCTTIRVPVGSKQLYVDAGLSSDLLNKMVEKNFNYIIE